MKWTEADDAAIRGGYADRKAPADIAVELGRTSPAVRNRAYRLGITEPVVWTVDELNTLEVWYRERIGKKALELDALAAILGRMKSNVCRKAREIGLTDSLRTNGGPRNRRQFKTDEELRARQSAVRKQWFAENDHPRGALGMRHTEATKARLSETSRQASAKLTAEQKKERSDRATQTKISRYGTGNPAMAGASNPYTRTKGGRRPDIGDQYFRSAWEANYARYLNFLIGLGHIARWEYEPTRFVFPGVTRGAHTYAPDFLIHYPNGRKEFHEVKGWMDGPSKTRLKRMAKHYPEHTVLVIGEKEYGHIAKHFGGAIQGWE